MRSFLNSGNMWRTSNAGPSPGQRFSFRRGAVRSAPVALVPRQHRSSVLIGIALIVAATWAWDRYDQHRQEQADRASVEYMERQRVTGIIARREANSRDLLAEVKRRLDAGEDPEQVKAWADQRRKDIQAEMQREIDGK
jgi:hypothetical protein